MTRSFTILLSEAQDGLRLDKALALAAPPEEALSRARIQALLRAGSVFLSGAPVSDPSARAYSGALYEIRIEAPLSAQPQPQALPLNIVFEDDDLLVLNKPAGLVVHPGAGNRDGTLVNALLAHCGESLSGIGGVARPGIVHRLDKETSGLLVVAKNDRAHQGLAAEFADRSISRTYRALVWGLLSPLAGQVEGAIGRSPRDRQRMAVLERGGKPALTFYKTIQPFGSLVSLIECKLATGRTHQIRVHMAHLGHPLVGDPLYGRRRLAKKNATDGGIVRLLEAFPRQALHAGELTFLHPVSHKRLHFSAPLPQDMIDLLQALAERGT